MSFSFQATDAFPGGATPFVRRRFTVDEFERMADSGILTPRDHVELLDGEIITMNPIGSPHASCLTRADVEIRRRLNPIEFLVRVQLPIRLPPASAPEPDLAVVTSRADFYAAAHPTSGDIHLVIEIADSSVNYDLHIKTAIYARAGIPEYWIVDLVHEVVEVRSGPTGDTYSDSQSLRRGDVLKSSIPVLTGIEANVLLG